MKPRARWPPRMPTPTCGIDATLCNPSLIINHRLGRTSRSAGALTPDPATHQTQQHACSPPCAHLAAAGEGDAGTLRQLGARLAEGVGPLRRLARQPRQHRDCPAHHSTLVAGVQALYSSWCCDSVRLMSTVLHIMLDMCNYPAHSCATVSALSEDEGTTRLSPYLPGGVLLRSFSAQQVLRLQQR